MLVDEGEERVGPVDVVVNRVVAGRRADGQQVAIEDPTHVGVRAAADAEPHSLALEGVEDVVLAHLLSGVIDDLLHVGAGVEVVAAQGAATVLVRAVFVGHLKHGAIVVLTTVLDGVALLGVDEERRHRVAFVQVFWRHPVVQVLEGVAEGAGKLPAGGAQAPGGGELGRGAVLDHLVDLPPHEAGVGEDVGQPAVAVADGRVVVLAQALEVGVDLLAVVHDGRVLILSPTLGDLVVGRRGARHVLAQLHGGGVVLDRGAELTGQGVGADAAFAGLAIEAVIVGVADHLLVADAAGADATAAAVVVLGALDLGLNLTVAGAQHVLLGVQAAVGAAGVAAGVALGALLIGGAGQRLAGLAKDALAHVVGGDDTKLGAEGAAVDLLLLAHAVVGLEVVQHIAGRREVVAQTDGVADLVLEHAAEDGGLDGQQQGVALVAELGADVVGAAGQLVGGLLAVLALHALGHADQGGVDERGGVDVLHAELHHAVAVVDLGLRCGPAQGRDLADHLGRQGVTGLHLAVAHHQRHLVVDHGVFVGGALDLLEPRSGRGRVVGGELLEQLLAQDLGILQLHQLTLLGMQVGQLTLLDGRGPAADVRGGATGGFFARGRQGRAAAIWRHLAVGGAGQRMLVGALALTLKDLADVFAVGQFVHRQVAVDQVDQIFAVLTVGGQRRAVDVGHAPDKLACVRVGGRRAIAQRRRAVGVGDPVIVVVAHVAEDLQLVVVGHELLAGVELLAVLVGGPIAAVVQDLRVALVLGAAVVARVDVGALHKGGGQLAANLKPLGPISVRHVLLPANALADTLDVGAVHVRPAALADQHGRGGAAGIVEVVGGLTVGHLVAPADTVNAGFGDRTRRELLAAHLASASVGTVEDAHAGGRQGVAQDSDAIATVEDNVVHAVGLDVGVVEHDVLATNGDGDRHVARVFAVHEGGDVVTVEDAGLEVQRAELDRAGLHGDALGAGGAVDEHDERAAIDLAAVGCQRLAVLAVLQDVVDPDALFGIRRGDEEGVGVLVVFRLKGAQRVAIAVGVGLAIALTKVRSAVCLKTLDAVFLPLALPEVEPGDGVLEHRRPVVGDLVHRLQVRDRVASAEVIDDGTQAALGVLDPLAVGADTLGEELVLVADGGLGTVVVGPADLGLAVGVQGGREDLGLLPQVPDLGLVVVASVGQAKVFVVGVAAGEEVAEAVAIGVVVVVADLKVVDGPRVDALVGDADLEDGAGAVTRSEGVGRAPASGLGAAVKPAGVVEVAVLHVEAVGITALMLLNIVVDRADRDLAVLEGESVGMHVAHPVDAHVLALVPGAVRGVLFKNVVLRAGGRAVAALDVEVRGDRVQGDRVADHHLDELGLLAVIPVVADLALVPLGVAVLHLLGEGVDHQVGLLDVKDHLAAKIAVANKAVAAGGRHVGDHAEFVPGAAEVGLLQGVGLGTIDLADVIDAGGRGQGKRKGEDQGGHACGLHVSLLVESGCDSFSLGRHLEHLRDG